MKNKKKWSGIIAAVMALLVLTSTAVPALAQSDEGRAVRPKPVHREELAIVAPRMAPVGEEVSMSVFERRTQNPVKDAAIWALTRESAETLKERIAEIREASDNATRDLDWESLVSDLGIFLGTTHGNGQLKYTFEEEGRYLLIALKEGYRPGRTGIAIRTLPDALAIEAPRRATPGEAVTMTVFQRGSEDPVKDAAVWALTREEAETLKARIAEIREASDNVSRDLDWESLVSNLGIFLGTTNGSGKLRYTFEEEGRYLLIALKEGYRPGRTGIAIKTPPEPRPVEVPNSARATQ